MADDLDGVFRSIFKSGSIVFVGFVVEMLISFFGKVLVARWLTRVDYGAVAIGSSLLSTLSVIVLLGMHTGVSRYLSRYDDDDSRRGVILSAFQISLPITVVVTAGIFILADPLATRVFNDSELGPVLQVFAVALPFLAVTKLSLGAVRGMQRTLPKIYIENLATPIFRLGLVVVAIVLGAQAIGVAWAYALARILPGIAGLYFLYRLTPLFSEGVRPLIFGRKYVPMRRQLLVFSLPLVVSAAMGRVLADFDTYLLGYYADLGLVGTYNVIYPIATAMGFVLSAFGYLTMPVISRLHAEKRHDEMAVLYQGVAKWVFLTTLPLLLVTFLFPRFIIGVTFGSKYLAGAAALQLLIVSYFVNALTGPNIQTLTSIGGTRSLMKFNIFAAVVNIVLNVLLIPRYELVGAAAATVIALVLLDVLVSVRLYRQARLQPFGRSLVLPAVFGIAVAAVLYAVVVRVVGVSPVSIVSMFVLFVPLYAVGVLWFGGIEQYEIMIVNSIEDRFDINLEPIKRIARRLM
ncbi:oligosaccharide flippase family protein [Haloplanus salinus]|jgi:O-antigen/teichoic acid export membrane protein|nr:oligosaccharide flippase family protein [Haloplanus salinus]